MAAVQIVNTIGKVINTIADTVNTTNDWAKINIPGFRAAAEMSNVKKTALLLGLFTAGMYARVKLSPKSKKVNDLKKKPDHQKSFLERLKRILSLIIRGKAGKKVIIMLGGLSTLLVLRTILSIQVAVKTGNIAEQLVQQNWEGFVTCVASFLLLGIPAAVVNSFLKYTTTMLALYSQRQLSDYINLNYIRGTNFYKANQLPSSKIENVDQRVTADVQTFCNELASLYSSVFKPILDVILNTWKLSGMMGIKAPFVIFAWYIFFGKIQITMLNNLDIKNNSKKLSEYEGNYRTSHSRLIVYAEEIAFFEGSDRERGLIGSLFDVLFKHHAKLEWLKAIVGVLDQFLLKYGTSITGYCLMALPVFFRDPNAPKQDVSELTRNYVLNRQLLMDLSLGIGTLLSTTTTIASFAGITQRVSEVLEKVEELNDKSRNKDNFNLRPNDEADKSNTNNSSNNDVNDDLKEWLKEWKIKGEDLRKKNLRHIGSTANSMSHLSKLIPKDDECVASKETFTALEQQWPLPKLVIKGENIKLDKVAIVSPDGRLLVKDLTITIKPGENVMITGPNGCGKSSLFRVLGELWPPFAGTVVKPPKEDIVFVPQKPYLVSGTLRDQIIYPHTKEDMIKLGITDADLIRLLDVVDPARSIIKEWKFDDVREWFNAFSGGQKQRIAMARVFYHRPRYAILDECTSAVSSDVEGNIYRTCRSLGITIFTVSHRPNLQQYHDFQLRFDGHGNYTYHTTEQVMKSKKLLLQAEEDEGRA